MWSPQQRSLLNAMGYTLYVRPSSLPTAQTPRAAETKPDTQHAAVSTHSTLFQALIKAAQGRDVAALNIDVQALRTSPQAKRALWPQLRQMLKR
jgi:hypothetical protein